MTGNPLCTPREVLTEAEQPSRVIHVDISNGRDTTLPEPPFVLYFWYEDWPLGELWFDAGHTTDDVREALASEITSDVLERARQGIQSAQASPSVSVSTSVVICTRDRPAALRRCLAALASQSRRPDQILVVDNASVDDSVGAIVRSAGCDYIREDRPGLDRARNAGARAAKGDIVLYTDDDVELHPRWLERLSGAFDADHVGAVTGLVLPAELATEAQWHFEAFWGFGRGYRRIDFGHDFYAADRTQGCPAWQIGAGASMGFRRQVFEAVGMFDERLDVGAAGCSGDSEYWHRLLGAGWTCRYEPSAVAFHHHRRDANALSRQIRAYMRGHAAALLVQFERSGNWGNLRRALAAMPLDYSQRVLRGALKGWTERDRMLREEIGGYLAGIFFYLRTLPSRSR